jgi:hypothetical protein
MWRSVSKLFIIFCLVFTQLPIANVFAEVDVTKPTFLSMSVDKTDVTVGDTVKFIIRASDTGSGLKNYTYLYYKSPITGKNESIKMDYNASAGRYEGSRIITDTMESGTWEVDWVTLSDNANNSTVVEGPINGSSFTITGTSADVTKPVFVSMSVDKTDVVVGDTVKFIIRATDTGSGLKNYTYLYYKSPITGKNESIKMDYNASAGRYEGSRIITDTMESGTWEVDWVTLSDNANNSTVIEGPIKGSSFTVTGTSADVTKPTFVSMSVDKTDVKVGDKVRFIIRATDTGSGLKNYTYLYYKSPITGKNESIKMDYNASTGRYEGSRIITDIMEPGKWEVDWVTLSDNANNSIVVDGPIRGSDFNVLDYRQDLTNPTFNTISVDKKTVDGGQSVGITTNAADNYLVKSVVVNYIKPLSNEVEAISLTPDSASANFSSRKYITSDSEYGEWKVSSVEVTDLNGNKTTVTENLSDGNFTVLKPIQPLGHRVVTSNETWSNQVIEGDVYIGPSAILTVSGNVRITGNVYVLGALRSNYGLTINGTLHAGRIYWGYYYGSYYNGDVILNGSNNISSMSVSNYPLQNVPLEVYTTELIVEDGKIDLQGATVPVVSVYLNNQWINLNSNGTFRLDDFKIGNASELTFKTIDVFGYVTYKTYPVIADVIAPIVEGVKHTEVYNTDKTITFNEGTAQLDGTAITSGTLVSAEGNHRLVVTDAAGNETVVEFVIDKTKPVLSSVDKLSDQSTSVTGTAEANATITVKKADEVLGTATANEKGEYTVGIPAQDLGVTLTVIATDKAGNASEPLEVTVQWAPKVNEISDKDSVVTGTAESGSTIYVKDGTETIGTAVTDPTGAYTVTIPVQKAGTKIGVMAVDILGVESPYTYVVVADKTAPSAPIVNEVSDQSTTVTGTAEAGSTVSVNVGETALGSAAADETGKYSVSIPAQLAGTQLVVAATDLAGNASEPKVITVLDKTAPDAPSVNGLTQISKVVTGKAEANSSVYVKVGLTVIGKGKAESNGSFAIEIPAQEVGTKLGVIVRDGVGYYSPYSYVTVEKKPAPLAPTVNVVSDQSTNVSGTAEVGSTVYVKVGSVVIGKGKTNSQGNFFIDIPVQPLGTKLGVVVRDEAANFSPYSYVTVEEKSVPFAAKVNEVTNKSTIVTGSAEANTTITVKVDADVIGTGKTDAEGNFAIAIPLQQPGTKLGIVVQDEAGNFSPITFVTVVEQLKPNAPMVNEVNDQATTVTGTAEINSIVYVKVGSVVIGKARTDSNGSFSIKIPAQSAGTKLGVVVRSAEGKYSSYTYVTVVSSK